MYNCTMTDEDLSVKTFLLKIYHVHTSHLNQCYIIYWHCLVALMICLSLKPQSIPPVQNLLFYCFIK